MAQHTRALLLKTEEAIQSFLEDDIEHTLPLIERLEEISYQLWKEQNSAFLFDGEEYLEDESVEWFWDEEVFYGDSSRLLTETSYTPYQKKLTYITDEDSNYSSYVESSTHSRSTSVSTSSSTGYLGSCESGLLAPTVHSETAVNTGDWIVKSNELSCKEDHDWLLVSLRTKQEECSIFDVNSCYEPDDWTILSMKVNSRAWASSNTLFRRTSPKCQVSPNCDNTSSCSNTRRRLFQSSYSDASVSPTESADVSDRYAITDSEENSAIFTSTTTTRQQLIERVKHVASIEEETNGDWIIICIDKGSPEKACCSNRLFKGQITPGSLPRFAAVT